MILIINRSSHPKSQTKILELVESSNCDFQQCSRKREIPDDGGVLLNSIWETGCLYMVWINCDQDSNM